MAKTPSGRTGANPGKAPKMERVASRGKRANPPKISQARIQTPPIGYSHPRCSTLIEPLNTLIERKSRMLQIQARPPSKPARHLPEAQLMADGQGEAAWGTEGEAVVIYCEL